MFDIELSEILEDSRPVAKRCGIYFLIDAGEIVYIGQSTNILDRVGSHFSEGKTFDRYYAVDVPKRYLNEVESFLIHRFKPRDNRTPPMLGFGPTHRPEESNEAQEKLGWKYGHPLAVEAHLETPSYPRPSRCTHPPIDAAQAADHVAIPYDEFLRLHHERVGPPYLRIDARTVRFYKEQLDIWKEWWSTVSIRPRAVL